MQAKKNLTCNKKHKRTKKNDWNSTYANGEIDRSKLKS